MKFVKIPDYIKFNHGDTRIKKYFLLFPKKIGYETRWLEFVTVEQVYISENRWIDRYPGVIFYHRKWNDAKFLENKK